MIKELIPVIGTRIKFKTNLNAFKKATEQVNIENLPMVNTQNIIFLLFELNIIILGCRLYDSLL